MFSKRWIKPISSQQNVILVSLAIIGAIGVYNWIIAPHRNYLQAAQEYQNVTENLTKKKQTIRNNLKIREKELGILDARLKAGLGMCFEPVEAKEFFNNIQDVSERSGCIPYSLTFTQTDSEAGAHNSDPNKIIIKKGAELTVLGGYGNITDLIKKIQENSKCVRIDSVRIYSDSNFPDYLKCDMSVTIYIRSRKENRRHEI